MGKQSLNSHTGSGNIGRDIEVRYTQSGTAVCDVSVAMNIGFGQRQKSIWLRLTVWGKQAEFLAQYAKKGDLIAWEGAEYNIDEFEKENGSKSKTHYFQVGQSGKVILLGGGGGKDQGGGEPAGRGQRSQRKPLRQQEEQSPDEGGGEDGRDGSGKDEGRDDEGAGRHVETQDEDNLPF